MYRNVTVACMGSRERYSLPVALNKRGALKRLFTDIYIPYSVSSKLRNVSKNSAIKAFLNRSHEDLPCNLVSHKLLLGLMFRRKVRSAKNLSDRQDLLINYGSRFASFVSRSMPRSDLVLGYTGQALEFIDVAKNQGSRVFIDQVDPGLHGWQVLKAESEKYAGWNNQIFSWSSDFQKRVENELIHADTVVVNSHYSKKCIDAWIGENKSVILPIPLTIQRKERLEINNKRPLRLLFLGGASIGKGIQYAVIAVHNLLQKGYEVELIIAGEMLISCEKLSNYNGWFYIGSVASNDIPSLLDSIDVLLFPTLSDGFGMVQTEAISRGVPVISTMNCASVIEHGKSGFVMNELSIECLQNYIIRYHNDRELLKEHSRGAFIRSQEFEFNSYIKKVSEVLSISD
ncbi:glycosyltransferase family 4 protein [Neptuniibacter sp. PT8_73]|uniref:glycosyltransferase family 4 protein n=1 Tax=Neptuniibacter sp. PT8_73 TaxID=3398206 RepID=UPI0039F57664